MGKNWVFVFVQIKMTIRWGKAAILILVEFNPFNLFLLTHRTHDIKLPQLDGAFDSPAEKQAMQRGKLRTNPRSPSKSSSKKYAPLNIVITKSPAVQRDSMAANRQEIPLKV